MKRTRYRIQAMVAVLLMVFGVVLAAPAASAAPAPAVASASSAVIPVIEMYAYKDTSYGGGSVAEHYRSDGDCTQGVLKVYYLLWHEMILASSAAANPSTSRPHCNAFYVRSANPDHPYYGECIEPWDPGIWYFGPGYEANVDTIALTYRPECSLYG